jgi:predicted enzyme related to lactoylglutathione lyase
MLERAQCAAQMPASDFARAKKFYQEKLGLKLSQDMGEGGARFDAGNGTFLWVYPSQFAGTNQATAIGFEVENVEKAVEDLSGKGITFEQYDLPGLKTDANGVAEGEGFKGAWFKDTEGNIIALAQISA